MITPIIGDYTRAPGGRPNDLTTVRAVTFDTASGLQLTIGAIAETVESSSDSLAIPATIAVRAALESLKRNLSRNPRELLIDAFHHANLQLLQHTQVTGIRVACSLVVAMIVDGERLYVANIGIGRVYLFSRVQGLIALTNEHTVANQQTGTGNAQPAGALPNQPVRALGWGADDEPDLGFYGGDLNYVAAQERGLNGYGLVGGDAVLVCTSAVFGWSPSGAPFVSDADLIDILSNDLGIEAAQAIVETAIEAGSATTIPAAVLQIPSRRQRAAANRGLIGVIIAIIALVGAIGVLALFSRLSARDARNAERTATAETIINLIAQTDSAGTSTALAPTATVSATPSPFPSDTPTRTPVTSTRTRVPASETPFPTISPIPSQTSTLIVGEIGAVFVNNGIERARELIRLGDSVDTFDGTYKQINVNNVGAALQDAQFFLQPNAELTIEDVGQNIIRAGVTVNSDVFIDGGGYSEGIFLSLGTSVDTVLSLVGTCMSVRYLQPDLLVASCYSGICSLDFTDPQTDDRLIPEGSQVIYVPSQQRASNDARISADEAARYTSILSLSPTGRQTADVCLSAYLATATATISPTTTLTRTATITATTTNTPTVTRTPTITPILTAIPTRTLTGSLTPSRAPAITLTPTRTRTPTRTPTRTATATSTRRRTFTPTPTLSPTIMLTSSNTPNTNPPATNPPPAFPTNTPVPPTATQLPPSVTPEAPTDTNSPPIDTSIPPTDPPPTDMPVPPTDPPPTDPPPTDPPPPTDTP